MIGTQTTLTQKFSAASWVCGLTVRKLTITGRTHYRMVLDVAGYPLLRLRGTAELLTCTYHAFQGEGSSM